MAETVIDRVMAMVRSACDAGNVGVRSVDVSEALHIDVEHANTVLSKLVRRGLLERPIRGLYSVHPPLTHRPSRLDAEHTACGLKLGDDTHLRLGDGETCEQCTHVVAQVAAAVRGETSWASVPVKTKITA